MSKPGSHRPRRLALGLSRTQSDANDLGKIVPLRSEPGMANAVGVKS